MESNIAPLMIADGVTGTFWHEPEGSGTLSPAAALDFDGPIGLLRASMDARYGLGAGEAGGPGNTHSAQDLASLYVLMGFPFPVSRTDFNDMEFVRGSTEWLQKRLAKHADGAAPGLSNVVASVASLATAVNALTAKVDKLAAKA